MFTCRVVNAPLAIQPDNIEVSYLLNCGMIVFHAENQQDMYDFIMAGFIDQREKRCDASCRCLLRWVLCDPCQRVCPDARSRHEASSTGAWRGAVPVLDAENPPASLSSDAPVQKSNFMAYNIHAVWQQEVWAGVERSRKYINQYMGGLLTAENVDDAEAVIIASAVRPLSLVKPCEFAAEKGIKIGLIKVRSLRPFPTQELRQVLREGQADCCSRIQLRGMAGERGGNRCLRFLQCKIIGGPRVYGGQSMPVELIVDEVESGLTGKKSTNVAMSQVMGASASDHEAMGHFMRSI